MDETYEVTSKAVLAWEVWDLGDGTSWRQPVFADDHRGMSSNTVAGNKARLVAAVPAAPGVRGYFEGRWLTAFDRNEAAK
jgi:hypothetical protein